MHAQSSATLPSMSLEQGHRPTSPGSSGKDSPSPPRRQLSHVPDDNPRDKSYRKYAAGVERTLALFDSTLQEWADYISFLNRLIKALQARLPTHKAIPAKALVAKRLSQCLNPSLPSGVHQKTLEAYAYIFSVMGRDGLSRDLALYLPGLAPTLSFASLLVRAPFFDLLERHVVHVDPRALRPAMKSIILALLPGLEDETSEDFERTFKLIEKFKQAIRPSTAKQITEVHATGDDFFWQCFFLATITGHGRRTGALAYLVRNLPKLGHPISHEGDAVGTRHDTSSETMDRLTELVTSPEPGLLLRCFAAGLADDQLLIQRGFLDLLVANLPLHSRVLQKKVKTEDLKLLLEAAVGVVIRKDMSLNRRLWSWLVGPELVADPDDSGMSSPIAEHGYPRKTSYFAEFGLQPLTQAMLGLIDRSTDASSAERAKPYRICLSLMDKWEVGGSVVPEVFLPIVDGVRQFKSKAASEAEFVDVLRSASVFFDGVESGLIYGVMVSLAVKAVEPGSLTTAERLDKLDLIDFMLGYFNVREEDMITIHAPLTALAILCLHPQQSDPSLDIGALDLPNTTTPREKALALAAKFMDLVPDRAFPPYDNEEDVNGKEESVVNKPDIAHLQEIRVFYEQGQGNLEAATPPFSQRMVGELLLKKALRLICDGLSGLDQDVDLSIRARILMQAALRASKYPIDTVPVMEAVSSCLAQPHRLSFVSFSSIIALVNSLFTTDRLSPTELFGLVEPLVRHAWTFLASGEPKYHVETVRCLWQLQTALTPHNRSIEATIAALMVRDGSSVACTVNGCDPGRSFAVLWIHTLQDHAHGPDRRTAKTPHHDLRSMPRLAGTDYFDVMLTRPLFLMLDALLDEHTQLFMTVKTWLHTMPGANKLFEILATKLCDLSFLHTLEGVGDKANFNNITEFVADDDLETCLYYLRTLSNVLRWSPDMFWHTLATVTVDCSEINIQRITGTEGDTLLQDFFLQVCMRCLAANNDPADEELKLRIAQVQRSALTIIHQLLLSPFANKFKPLGLETILVDRLSRSLKGPDPYIQVLLLDVVCASLRICDMNVKDVPELAEPPTPTTTERRGTFDWSTTKLPMTIETVQNLTPPPASLQRCIQSGFTVASSRPVLDSWVRFLTECLPRYADTIFQVLIPLVQTFCSQIELAFSELQALFRRTSWNQEIDRSTPESAVIFLLNGLEYVLSESHKQLVAVEMRKQTTKTPEQPQSFLGSVVSGVFTSDPQQSRSATANDRLTVLLGFQDAVRMCFKIWSWGQGPDEKIQDASSAASFNYTSLRIRNRARRLLEHLFTAETLECLEAVVEIWKSFLVGPREADYSVQVLNMLPALAGLRPMQIMPATFNAVYSRTNPAALDPARRSTLTIDLTDTDLAVFLVDYTRSLEDDAMDEIWHDCLVFLKDLLANPFPHRQILPSLLEFTAVLGEKVDNTNFGDDRKRRKELGDLFLRLLTALFTTRPMNFDNVMPNKASAKTVSFDTGAELKEIRLPSARAEDVVGILAALVPILPAVVIEPDRVVTAATAISNNVVGPCLKSRSFPDNLNTSLLNLMQELAKLPNNQKVWRKDVSDAFNDGRFFGTKLDLVRSHWLSLLRQWAAADNKERVLVEILGRVPTPSSGGIVFSVGVGVGVGSVVSGATVARQEADRRAQVNLRRAATVILAGEQDAFSPADVSAAVAKAVELLVGAAATTSPSAATRADAFLLLRALVLRCSPQLLAPAWPAVLPELRAILTSSCAPAQSTSSTLFSAPSAPPITATTSSTTTTSAVAAAGMTEPADPFTLLQACKLLDLLVCLAPDDWQLSQWLFVTDTVDAVFPPPLPAPSAVTTFRPPVALVDELNNLLVDTSGSLLLGESAASIAAKSRRRRPLIGAALIPQDVVGHGGEDGNESGRVDGDEGGGAAWLTKREELIAKVVKPFFAQLSIYAFESTYAMVPVDLKACEELVLRDLFDERGLVKGA